MTTEKSNNAERVQHLRCNRCGDRVGVACFDGVAKLVCHCTHVDGEIDPEPVDDMNILPTRWHYA